MKTTPWTIVSPELSGSNASFITLSDTVHLTGAFVSDIFLFRIWRGSGSNWFDNIDVAPSAVAI